MGILNNRETAIAIYAIIALSSAIFISKIRNSIFSLFRSFFQLKILATNILAILYSSLGILILHFLNLWTFEQIKEALLWILFPLIKTMINISEVRKNKNYFQEAIYENFKITIFLEFIINFYSFSLLIEMIINPIILILAIIFTTSTLNKKYALLTKVSKFIISFITILIITITITQITKHFHEFATIKTLREFITAPFLAIWILPFIYLMSVYMQYESAFILLQFDLPDLKLRKNAKWQTLLKFNFNLEGLERWNTYLNLIKIKNETDISASINEIKRLQKIEKNPPIIDDKMGWSPYLAKDFLKDLGISTNFYQNYYENEWTASSNYIKVTESDFNPNTIAFYVYGDEKIAKKLELILDINSNQNNVRAIELFCMYIQYLFLKALGEKLPVNVIRSLRKKKTLQIIHSQYHISITKDIWQKDKFTLGFIIEHTPIMPLD